jgi:hypothetical protein
LVWKYVESEFQAELAVARCCWTDSGFALTPLAVMVSSGASGCHAGTGYVLVAMFASAHRLHWPEAAEMVRVASGFASLQLCPFSGGSAFYAARRYSQPMSPANG